MEEYYRKKLLNRILEENADEYNRLKKKFEHVLIPKFDRNMKTIDFPLWLILLREKEYRTVQQDFLEETMVSSVWIGDLEAPFELLVVQKNVPIYRKPYFSEDTLLKDQEKVVFLVEQKLFSPQHK